VTEYQNQLIQCVLGVSLALSGALLLASSEALSERRKAGVEGPQSAVCAPPSPAQQAAIQRAADRFEFDDVVTCTAIQGGQPRIDVLDASGLCPLRPDDGGTVFYRHLRAEDIEEAFRAAVPEVIPPSPISTQRSQLLDELLAATVAATVHSDISALSAEHCDGPSPVPGSCGTDEMSFQCCIASEGTPGGGTPTGGGNGPGGGSSGGGGGGGGSGGPTPGQFELIYAHFGGAPSFLIVDVTERKFSSKNNRFGVCLPEAGAPAPVSGVIPGARQSAGCGAGRHFLSWPDFIKALNGSGGVVGATEMSALVIEAIAVGVVVITVAVVTGVLALQVSKVRTGPTPQSVNFDIATACDTLCIVGGAAMRQVADAAAIAGATTVIYSEMVTDFLKQAGLDQLKKLGLIKGWACCKIACQFIGEASCTADCENACNRVIAPPVCQGPIPPLVPGHPLLACTAVGLGLGLACR